VVSSFVATPPSITQGGTSVLSWTVVGATTVVIVDADDAEVYSGSAASATVEVTPTSTTTYTLIATNAAGSAEANTTVTVTADVSDGPTIAAFSAQPSSIELGSSTTLSWQVTGSDIGDISLTSVPVGLDVSGLEAVGTRIVSPTETTVYTITVTPGTAGLDPVTQDVTVTVVPPGAATLSELAATIVTGSRTQLTWTSVNATSFDVYAVHASEADVLIEGGIAGSATSATVAIPASDRQTLRVIARSAGGDATATVDLTGVVVSALDYDLYVGPGFAAEPEVPGTLRSVVASAAEGAIIGFAADIAEIELYGVDLTPNGEGIVDAHLILRQDVTISGPAAGVTIRGVAGVELGDPGVVDPFTWQSRVLYVSKDATVVIENLVITGGTFIYKGAGIRNDGDLTVRNTTITGNRSWDNGGGIYNNVSAVLSLEGSTITGNTSAVNDDEVNQPFSIRDSADPNAQIVVTNGGYGGGLYNNGGTVTIVDSVITDNEAKVSGGGIYNHDQPAGAVSVIDSEITDNRADFSLYADNDPGFSLFSFGGGVLNLGTFTVSGTAFDGNDARFNGGGLYLSAGGTASLATVQFDRNSAEFGGAIFHQYFVGESDNLTLAAVPDTGTNVARDAGPFIYEQELALAPTVATSSTGQRPGLFDLLPSMDPRVHDR
jgi:predicted outer membrane repeat protein